MFHKNKLKNFFFYINIVLLIINRKSIFLYKILYLKNIHIFNLR